MIKRNRAFVLMLLAASSGFWTTGAMASDNQDACGAILCLAGAIATGGKPGGCDKYIEKYFSIQVFNDGFSPAKTIRKRMSFLQQCTSDQTDTKQQVNNRYGGVMNAPF